MIKRTLDAGLEPLQFVGLHALGEAFQFGQQHVQRFLGSFGAGSRVAEHAAAVAQGVTRGIDRIAESAFFADFRE